MPTKRDDLTPDPQLPTGTIQLDRQARVFTAGADRVRALESAATKHRLATDAILHPEPPCDLVVRRGNLRLSEFLADGREVTRAILQTGAVCRVRDDEPLDTDSEPTDSPVYSLRTMVLMALGESTIWRLPPGHLEHD